MKKILISIVTTVFIAGFTISSCFAANSIKMNEAIALVKDAGVFLKANGKTKAFEEINNHKGQFVKGELYIFAIDKSGLMLAHGANPKLIGKNMINYKDPKGTYFIKEFIAVAQKGNGWVDYKWANPVTKRIESKSTYIESAGDVILGCGVYY